MSICTKTLLQVGNYNIYCKLQHNTVFWDNPSVTLQACLGTNKISLEAQ